MGRMDKGWELCVIVGQGWYLVDFEGRALATVEEPAKCLRQAEWQQLTEERAVL
jgi:hypothetical protein